MPDGYKLFNIYPNPYNPETTIKFQIPQASFVTLKVYNIQGRLMKSILEKNMETGTYEVTFNSSNVSSGIYFVQMIANKFVGAKKMLIVK
jgi:5-hydroxyisourate hydrolase-like protein (transthyretin family)